MTLRRGLLRSAGAAIVDVNTVGLWHLDDNLTASVGSDLTLNGGAPAAYAAARFANGWKKDGVRTLTIDDYPTFPMQGTTDWTIDFVYNPALPGTNKEAISTRTGNDFTGFLLLTNTNALRLLLAINGAAAWAVDSGNKTCTDNTLHHIALERYGTLVSFYIDGARVHQQTISASDTINYGGAGCRIGSNAGGPNPVNTGVIYDEIRLSDAARYQGAATITVPTSPY